MKYTGTEPDLQILFEDKHLIAVNKPAGVLSQPDGSGRPDVLTLTKSYLNLESSGAAKAFLGLLHRLDMPVTGVMLLAKTSSAAASLSEQIRNRKVKKTYKAIVEGEPPENGYLSDYLIKEKSSNTVKVTKAGTKGAKLAELFFERVQKNDRYSILEVTIITGRAHQIRVQLAHAGFPIFGDRKYGSAFEGDIALHSFMLKFKHPSEDKKKTIFTEPPLKYPWSLLD